VAEFCENLNEPSGYLKGGEIFGSFKRLLALED